MNLYISRLFITAILAFCSFQMRAQSEVEDCVMVVLGSSTAEGSGASVKDSSWVGRYTHYLAKNSNYKLINLARGGYTTFQIVENGSFIPAELNTEVDTLRNITKALTYHPSIIIINMPSNDASRGVDPAVQMKNYEAIYSKARKENIEVWICTPQPRNFKEENKMEIIRQMRQDITGRFGDRSIDFWSLISAENGFILPQYDSGDGVHLNDAGHKVLFDKMVRMNVMARSCLKK